jgi:hypothetical protein
LREQAKLPYFLARNLLGEAKLPDQKLVPPGFRINPKDHEVSISTDALERILDSFERTLALCLDWAGNHPFEFTLVIALIGFLGWLHRQGITERTRMVLVYKEKRENSRIPELQLPPPAPHLPAPAKQGEPNA